MGPAPGHRLFWLYVCDRQKRNGKILLSPSDSDLLKKRTDVEECWCHQPDELWNLLPPPTPPNTELSVAATRPSCTINGDSAPAVHNKLQPSDTVNTHNEGCFSTPPAAGGYFPAACGGGLLLALIILLCVSRLLVVEAADADPPCRGGAGLQGAVCERRIWGGGGPSSSAEVLCNLAQIYDANRGKTLPRCWSGVRR